MVGFGRRIVAILVALGFLAGGVAAGAAPLSSAEMPCPHGHLTDHHRHHRNHRAADCLGCCGLGICATVPVLPAALAMAPTTATVVAYWSTPRGFTNRSISPDLGPPRPAA